MGETTNISWADSTASPWTICTEAGEDCQNCYVKGLAARYGWGEWGKGKPRHKFTGFEKSVRSMNNKPWVCDACGAAFSLPGPRNPITCHKCGKVAGTHRRRLFPSLMDWLDAEVPIDYLGDFLQCVWKYDNLLYLLLTKRPKFFFERLELVIAHYGKAPSVNDAFCAWLESWIDGDAPAHVRVGATVGLQKYDYRVQHLRRIPSVQPFLSCEPLIGPLELDLDGVALVIAGGESGPNARPCDINWLRDIVRQCKVAGTSCFIKQLGSNPIMEPGPITYPTTHPKGGDKNEWPEDLRVQQFPEE